MIEKLISIITNIWEFFIPFIVINEFEGGVVLKLGHYNRTLGTGLHWFIPFGIEVVISTETAITTMGLRAQTLTTLDQQTIVISSIIKYEIKNVKPYLLEIRDEEDVLSDVTLGTIKRIVNNTNYQSILTNNIEKLVLQSVRNDVNKYGFKVHNIIFADMGKIKTLRLITDDMSSVMTEE